MYKRKEVIGNCTLILGDCLEVMPTLDKVDSVIADIPYGTTSCSWDSVISFSDMWNCINNLIYDNGAICLFGAEPFSSHLRLSNLDNYKYDWTWIKSRATNFHNSKNAPLKATENISVFSNGSIANCAVNRMNYYPQGLISFKQERRGTRKNSKSLKEHRFERPSNKEFYMSEYTNYPNNVLKFKSETDIQHPTQKPIALMQYLIKTYSNAGQTILDFTMGSGSTLVACAKTGRHGIGIELDEEYFNIACKRVEDAYKQGDLFI